MTIQPPDPRVIARVSKALADVDIPTVLIGGIALVVLGSSRATRDCDLAAAKTDTVFRAAIGVMIDLGFGVIFGWDPEKYEPTKCDMDKKISGSWAVIQQPESIWFWHLEEKMRFDLVFDLPVPLDEMLARARAISIHGARIHIASPEDLIRMKEASLAANPERISDEQDLVFLRHLLKGGSGRTS